MIIMGGPRRARIVLIAVLIGFAGPSTAGEDIAAAFHRAPPAFSPVPIWWWSGDRIERDRLADQLRRMAAGGIRNVIVLNLAPSGPLYGSAADDPPFLTDQWWDLFGYALTEAKRLGVRLWFYDQLGFSGAGLQARLVRDNPSFRGIELRRGVRDVTGPAEVPITVPPGGALVAAFTAKLAGEAKGIPLWIWDRTAPEGVTKRYFRRVINIAKMPKHAELVLSCDNGYVAYVNGVKVGEEPASSTEGWAQAERYAVAPHLREGRNVIAICAENAGGPGGLIVEFRVVDDPEAVTARLRGEWKLVSNGNFRVSPAPPEGWTETAFDDAAWPRAHVIGAPPVAPWGTIDGISGREADQTFLGTRIYQVRRVDQKAIEEGTVRVGAGQYRLQVFATVPGGFDYHNPEACAAVLSVVHGEMERRFGAELGNGIAGSFQDEFPRLPRFSRRLIEAVQRECDYSILDRLPALFDEVIDQFDDPLGPTTIQIRCEANRIAARLAEEAFFVPLRAWHEKHGLLCGYDQTVRNADPIGGGAYYIDYFKTLRHYSVPGNDHSGDAKPHQSIADLYERPRVWLEAFHSSGWGQTLEDIVTLLHPWYAGGSTLYNPHAIYYSTHGSFWEWAPPDTGWRQPYFVHYKVLADYVARLSYMLSRGRHAVDVGVLHPAKTVAAYTGFGPPHAAARLANETYWAVQQSLREERIDYIIVDEDSIERADTDGGVLKVGSVKLRLLVLPATRVLGTRTATKLRSFVTGGGTVVMVAAVPETDVPADRGLMQRMYAPAVITLRYRAVRRTDPADTAAAVIQAIGRDCEDRRPVLHRRIGDRHLYFVLSDVMTEATWEAQYRINERRLWETPAAQGARMSCTFRADGIPELWNAVSGEIMPIHNFRRAGGRTRVDVELSSTPAPIIVLRPAGIRDPVAIESNLQILAWEFAPGNTVRVRGLPRLDATLEAPAAYEVDIAFAGGRYRGAVRAGTHDRIEVHPPFDCTLEPTIDNTYGDLAWPPAPGPLPVEVRRFRFREEQTGEDAVSWKTADVDDSEWETVIASFGPRARWTGPLARAGGERFETISTPPQDFTGTWTPVVYSPTLGIDEDPVFRKALGGKGRIPEEFIDIGGVKAGDAYLVQTWVRLPPMADEGNSPAVSAMLRVGGEALKRAFLNGEEVSFEGDPAARIRRAAVELRGLNRLELLAARRTDGNLRLFYQFLPPEAIPPDPQWIWGPIPNPSGSVLFSKIIRIPGEVHDAAMVVAVGDMHRIRINGTLVADQGNFDPYFTSRAEQYDIAAHLTTGENRLQIEARDPGHAVGLLLDGLVTLKDGSELPFVSDTSFTATAAGVSSPARILAGPSQGYLGETALLLLRPRPHPLPHAGWLVNQQLPPFPFDRLEASASREVPAAGWYRFRLPPGATALHLTCRGEVGVFVNGQEIPLARDGHRLTAPAPNPRGVKRIAALRIEPVRGFEKGAAIEAPVTCDMDAGRIPLGSWDELGLPHYAGGLRYATAVELPAMGSRMVILDLGRVRGSADVRVNGIPAGVRIWHPYRFAITEAVKPGRNVIEIRVFNTLGPHFAVGHPSGHVFENQTRSGMYGPVSITLLEPVEIDLKRVER